MKTIKKEIIQENSSLNFLCDMKKMPENIIQKGMTLDEKFDRNTFPEPNSGCWLWGGYVNTTGYGMIYSMGLRVMAHRYSFERHHNTKLPKKLMVCHKCNNTYCVNPQHLYAGTQTDNMSQAYREGRMGGHLYKRKPVGQYSISGELLNQFVSLMEAYRQTGIFQSAISNCISGRSKTAGGFKWAHVSENSETTFEINYEKEKV